jgi:hypothetical protein
MPKNILPFHEFLQHRRTFVNGMRNTSNITPKRLFLNIKKRDRFNF